MSAAVASAGFERVLQNGVLSGSRVRVYLLDGRERVLFFKEENPTSKAVTTMLCEKEGIPKDLEKVFSLWISTPDLELQLKPTQDLEAIVTKWPRWVEKYTHRTEGITYRFVFKREAMLSKEVERKIRDEACINLLYAEAKHNIFLGRVPCGKDEAVGMAGIQLQITFGDFKPDIHKPGFIINDLSVLIPDYMLKHMRPADWEHRALSAYATGPARGQSKMLAKLLYLQIARQSPAYGSSFFPACRQAPPAGFFEMRGNDRLLVGVNAEGVHIVDEIAKKLVFSEIFDNISWDKETDAFILEYGPLESPLELRVITPQAYLIGSLVSRAIKNLDKKDLEVAKMRAIQSGGDLRA